MEHLLHGAFAPSFIWCRRPCSRDLITAVCIHRVRKKRPPKHVQVTLWIENDIHYFSLYHEKPSVCNVCVKFHYNQSVHCWDIAFYNKKAVLSQRLPRDARYIVYREALRRYGNSKLSKMATAAILNLFESKIAPLDPPSPKTPL